MFCIPETWMESEPEEVMTDDTVNIQWELIVLRLRLVCGC